MLIDRIIEVKTKYTPSQFTGGNIQFSVSKYTQTLSLKLVLYFGFNSTRNPISTQIDIQEEDIHIISEELLIKAKAYRDLLLKDKTEDILDLKTFVKHSYEGGTTIVRGTTSDSDTRIELIDDRDDRDTKQSAKASELSIPTREAIRDSTIHLFQALKKKNVKVSIPIALNNLHHEHYKKLYSRLDDAKKLINVNEDEFAALLEELMIFKFNQKGFRENDAVSFNTFLYQSNFNKYLEQMIGA